MKWTPWVVDKCNYCRCRVWTHDPNQRASQPASHQTRSLYPHSPPECVHPRQYLNIYSRISSTGLMTDPQSQVVSRERVPLKPIMLRAVFHFWGALTLYTRDEYWMMGMDTATQSEWGRVTKRSRWVIWCYRRQFRALQWSLGTGVIMRNGDK